MVTPPYKWTASSVSITGIFHGSLHVTPPGQHRAGLRGEARRTGVDLGNKLHQSTGTASPARRPCVRFLCVHVFFVCVCFGCPPCWLRTRDGVRSESLWTAYRFFSVCLFGEEWKKILCFCKYQWHKLMICIKMKVESRIWPVTESGVTPTVGRWSHKFFLSHIGW